MSERLKDMLRTPSRPIYYMLNVKVIKNDTNTHLMNKCFFYPTSRNACVFDSIASRNEV